MRRWVLAAFVGGALLAQMLSAWAVPQMRGGGSVASFGLSPFCLDAANQDVCLARDAADTLGQRRGTNAQTLRVYNTYTSSTSYEDFEVAWAANVLTLQTSKGSGGGSQRNFAFDSNGFTFKTGGTTVATLSATNGLSLVGTAPLIWNSDNANDIGASGANRPRTLYAGTSVNAPTYLSTTRCANTGSPAVCAAAPAGSVVIAAAATAVVVNTTAVTANSQVFAMIDRSLGTLLSVTCDTTSDLTTGSPAITARTAGTSFTIAVPIAPAANPMCLSYFIVN